MDSVSMGSGLFEYLISKFIQKAIAKKTGEQDPNTKIVFNQPVTLNNDGETVKLAINITAQMKTSQLMKLIKGLGF